MVRLMKIATYNIWNDNKNINARLKLLIMELKETDADIIALQEVKDESTFKMILKDTGFEYGHYFDGLAFLSNVDIKVYSTYSENNNYMLRVVYENTSITNVHLDWKQESTRLQALEEYFSMLEEYSLDNEILLGDFNDTPEDKLHFELVISDFSDIHQEYSHIVNELPLPTLDIKNNPRWRNIDTEELPSRFDWIMLNTAHEYSIEDVRLIGVEETNGMAPSDHYGVLASFNIKE